MADKSTGIDFDRQAFVQTPQPAKTNSASRVGGLIFGLVIIAVLAFLGYKLLQQNAAQTSASSTDPALADIDHRLSSIEERLDKIERSRKTALAEHRKAVADLTQGQGAAKAPVKTVYRISPAPWQASQQSRNQVSGADQATKDRLAALQEGIGQLQKDQTANNDAWQATTDRLADVAGQVGTQNVQILRNQDELNELVNRTDMEAIPFELLRGSNPTPVGPVALVLKSTNPKKQSYTLCVYVQPTCIELKDRMIHEVVQFVASRNSQPLEVIATRIVKDEILGYLEVPRSQLAH